MALMIFSIYQDQQKLEKMNFLGLDVQSKVSKNFALFSSKMEVGQLLQAMHLVCNNPQYRKFSNKSAPCCS